MTTLDFTPGERLALLAMTYLKQHANYFDGWSVERLEAHHQALIAACAECGVSIQEALAAAAEALAIEHPELIARLRDQVTADQRAAVRRAALEQRERPQP